MLEKDEIKVYEGSSPYIFVSYSHRDVKFVYPLLRLLVDKGYRIWFDKGIKPGFNWTDVIAEHLENSYVVLAIISDNSLKSEDCRRELDFAVSERKPMIPIVINNAKMNAGMKMQVSSIQSIYCTDKEVIESVEKSLEKVKYFAECKNVEAIEKEMMVKEPIKKKQRKGKFLKKKIVSFLLVFFIIGSIGSVLYLIWQKNNFRYDPNTMYRMTLIAPSEMSVKEFNDSEKIIERRVEKLAGKGNYHIELDEEKIQLYINKDVFGDDNKEDVLKEYISGAVKLYLTTCKGIIDEKKNIEVNREDIEKIEEKEGLIEGVNDKNYDGDSQEYFYLELTLTDQFVEKNYDIIKKWNEEVVLAQDLMNTNFNYYTIHMSNDGKKVDVLIGDLDDKYLELTKFIWTEQALSDDFCLQMDIENLAEWDSVNKTESSNQVNISDFTDKTIIILYNIYETDISNGQWVDMKESFKTRLEVLDQPYSIGQYKDSNHSYLVVKTTLNHMGSLIMNMMGRKQPFELQRSLMVASISKWDSSNNKLEVNNNKLILKLNEEDDLNELKRLCSLKNEDELSLSVDNIPIVSTNIDKVTKDGRIEFSKLDISNEKELADDNIWLAKLIETIWNDNSLPFDLDYDSHYFVPDSKGKVGTEDDFGMEFQLQKKEIIDKIQSEVEDAKILINDSFFGFGTVNVTLNLEVNEMLPKSILEVTEKIYRASDFEKSIFNNLSIHFIDEDKSKHERVAIYLKKDYGQGFSKNKDGYINISGVFMGGRLDKYRESFESLVTTNKFIKEFHTDDEPWILGYLLKDIDEKDINIYIGNDHSTVIHHINGKVGETIPVILAEVNVDGARKNNSKFSPSLYAYEDIIKVSNLGNQKCKVVLVSEGTANLRYSITTKDYYELIEDVYVSVYTPVESYRIKVPANTTLYSCAAEQTDTENTDVIGKLDAKSKVTVLGTCEDFLYVKTNKDVYGFIEKSCLK